MSTLDDNFLFGDEEKFPASKLEECIRVAKSFKKEKDKETVDEKFNLDIKKCTDLAKKDAEKILAEIKKKLPANQDLKAKGIDENFLREKLIDFKKDQWAVKTDRRIIQKRIEAIEKKREEEGTPVKKLDKDANGKDSAKRKTLDKKLDVIAGVGLAVIGVLMVISIACPLSSIGSSVSDGAGFVCPEAVGENASAILNSNFMAVLVTSVIAPVVVRVAKAKYDIDIETSQLSMIFKDSISAVSMWQKSANRLRDENGKIPKQYQEKLRDLAYTSIRENYDDEKYKELVSNVGSQVYEKAIEKAVAENIIKEAPLKKEQIKSMISLSVDTVPAIVDWQKLDKDVKIAFLDGHVRKLLQTAGVEGIALKELESYLDAETSNRLAAVLVAKAKGLLPEGETNHEIYTTTILKAALGSAFKTEEKR